MSNLTKQQVLEYLEQNYTEDQIETEVTEAIFDFLDDEWEDAGDGYDNEEDWYTDFGRGEAEGQVRMNLSIGILQHFGDITEDQFHSQVGENTWDILKEKFEKLNVD